MFADTDIAHRNIEFIDNADDHPALGGSIKFGDHQSGEFGGFQELPGLENGVLPGTGIEDEEDLMGGFRDLLTDDPYHFFQFDLQQV